MLNKPRNYKIISLLIKIFFYLAKQIILDDVFRPLQFGIFSISVKELIHCKGGGRWHWAVSALMGLQESDLLYGGSRAAPKLPSWGDAVFQSHRS